ncbi:phage portal protein [Desulfobulbus rhabdoformis]|uniref:phage portal protein n=1 Tax=Desulfobulbus rhabdoformis TaxID=34032 RepID=UPI0019668AD6|nr:phage portal protein [Desulfobulbus rhabdoformis]
MRTFVRSAGVHVNEDNALNYSAVWSCVKIISETIACLPWHVYKRVGAKNKEVMNGHIDWMLYRQPNSEMTSFTLKEVLVAWALTWGNGYAEIERDFSNRISALWPIPPHRVEPVRLENGQLFYRVFGDGFDEVYIPAANMLHLHGLGYDGLSGYSVISMAAKSIALGLACEQFGSNYFENGTHPGVVASHPNKLTDRARKNLEESLMNQYSGLGKSHRLLLLEEATKLEKIGFSPNDSQFLETRKFQLAEIARWFRMPLHKMSDLERSTNNNIEHQGIEFATDTILPWATRIECETDVKLFAASRGRTFNKLNMGGLLRGDVESRTEHYKVMSNLGAFSVNDILELEDRNTIGPVGDKRLVQINQTTLEKIGEEPVEPAGQDEPNHSDKVTDAVRPIFEAAARDISSREVKRAIDAQRRGVLNSQWISIFSREHSRYIERKITPACEALGEILELRNSDISVLISGFKGRHLRMIQDDLLNPELDSIEERSVEISNYLIDQAVRIAALKRS